MQHIESKYYSLLRDLITNCRKYAKEIEVVIPSNNVNSNTSVPS
jgi:hypothetical protein